MPRVTAVLLCIESLPAANPTNLALSSKILLVYSCPKTTTNVSQILRLRVSEHHKQNTEKQLTYFSFRLQTVTVHTLHKMNKHSEHQWPHSLHCSARNESLIKAPRASYEDNHMLIGPKYTVKLI